MKGTRVCSKMLPYSSAFIIPSKMQMLVAPRKLIPAHTWTLIGCLALYRKIIKFSYRNNYYYYLGLSLGGCPILLQEWRRWVSSCTLLSSDHITSSKHTSFWDSAKLAVAHISLFSLLTLRINWQYALPLNVHPNSVRQRSTVRRLTVS